MRFVMPSGAGNKVSALQAQLIRPAQQVVTQWAGGETRQLAIAPASATVAERNFHWRFSTATVQQSGPFSTFAGYQRYLAVRSGSGITLTVQAGPVQVQQVSLFSPQHQAVFAGHVATSATLLDGPVQDINLMLRPDLQGGLRGVSCQKLHPLELSAVVNAQWLIYADGVDAGQQLLVESSHQQWTLQQGDVLVLPAAHCRLTATEDCAVVAAWIAPLVPA